MMASLESYGWLLGAVVVAVGCIVVVARSMESRDIYEARPRRVLTVIVGTLAIVIALVMQFVRNERWLWLAALLPTYFAVQHGIGTGIFKNPRFFESTQEPDLSHLKDARVADAVRKKILQERQLYSTPSLALRFLLPGIVLMLAIVTIGYTMLSPPEIPGYQLEERFIHGLQLGAMGAYLYVVIYLGGRTMRGDITPASLIWALATIVAGPLLGGILQLIVGEVSPTGNDGVWPNNAKWNDLLLPFAAGFSLRIVVSFINASIRRLLTDRVVTARGESLLRIRGITYDIEERLIEEGVEDVAMLADANPVRLHRNMRFDRRQIISWIDEALLMKYLPNAWQSLENDGITGAVDLVWYVEYFSEEAIRDAASKGSSMSQDAMVFAKLAERNKIDVAALAEVVLRMYTDGQVLLIWGLYQLEEGPGDSESHFTAELVQTADLAPGVAADDTQVSSLGAGLNTYRESTYHANQMLFIVHSWKRSTTPNQLADINIRLVEHPSAAPTGVRRVSYFMGRHFGNRVITSESMKDSFGIKVSAYRPMLCVAQVEFTNNSPPIWVYRYIDFDLPSKSPPNESPSSPPDGGTPPVAGQPRSTAEAPPTPPLNPAAEIARPIADRDQAPEGRAVTGPSTSSVFAQS
jgi:prokaryotic YEATS domain